MVKKGGLEMFGEVGPFTMAKFVITISQVGEFYPMSINVVAMTYILTLPCLLPASILYFWTNNNQPFRHHVKLQIINWEIGTII